MVEKSRICNVERVLFIHNPVAGQRDQRRLRRAVAALGRLGCDIELVASAHSGDAARQAHAAASGTAKPDVIVAAGGDGTINEVANGLVHTNVPLAVLPLGTANVYARELGVPADPDSWAHMIVAGYAETVYLGAVEDRCFVAMVSAGFDSRAVAKVNPGIKRYFGGAAYALEGLRTLFSGGGDCFRVTVDGTEYEAGWVIVGKTAHFAGPFRLVPTARPTASDLGVALFPVRGVGRLYDLLVVGCGRVDAVRGARFLTAKQVRIDCAGAVDVQMDGDHFGTTPVEITVGPPLTVVVPRTAL